MLAAMAPPPTSLPPVKTSLPASLSPASLAAAYSSSGSNPMSPAASISSQCSPKSGSVPPSSASTAAILAAKPPLAAKPVAPAPTVRPLQKAADAADGNVMSMTSVVSPAAQSPAAQGQAGIGSSKPSMSITSKEWVIPPRPKPGRKPATDTPPTKRKAQNRAAQRAFRERRAARVGELEEQLEEQKAEHDRAEREYQDKIRALETSVQVLRSRCDMLETLLDKERAANQAWATKERQKSTSSSVLNDGGMRTPSHQLLERSQPHDLIHARTLHKPPHRDLPPAGSSSSSVSSASGRRVSTQPFSISQIISPPDAENLTCGKCSVDGPCACAEEVIAATATIDCGKCSIGTKCICLEESIEETMGALATGGGDRGTPAELKRPHTNSTSPLLAPSGKKVRHNDRMDSATEIDFTNVFGRPKPTPARTPLPSMQPRHLQQDLRQDQQRDQLPPPRFEIPLKDKCGFCSDGTYCVCADSMPGVTMTGSLAISTGAVVSQQKTPPPSENDGGAPTPLEVTASGAIKLSSFDEMRRRREQEALSGGAAAMARSRCGPDGPGTCSQCLADPVSGLFCRSLAANFERRDGGSAGGCCGGGGPGGGCCKDKKSSGVLSADSTRSGPTGSISLSCADAYKTLASHRHFTEATDEIGTWLPKLRAAPRHDSSAAMRHPMEVEAASIMSVLRGFDVRFGK